jgi:antitoxin (DNA-binding transcriptional repressor) of toxin-antitoxin stability system
MQRTMAATDARTHFRVALEAAESGETTLIFRHSKPAAALVPARDLEIYGMFVDVVRELGEIITDSEDVSLIAAVHKAEDEIAKGKVTWLRVPLEDPAPPAQRKPRKAAKKAPQLQ